MKRILCFFLTLLLGVSAKGAEKSAYLGKLHQDLRASSDIMDERYTRALDAYVRLMELGKPGFRVLADAWVYDRIPEGNWLQWYDDFLVRYGKGVHDDTADAYYAYLNDRMVNDDEFALAAAKRLREVYDNRTLLEWLKAPMGQRRVAYISLKEKYPGIPKFSFAASDKTRAAQFSAVEMFVNGRK